VGILSSLHASSVKSSVGASDWVLRIIAPFNGHSDNQ
jgi:hypothetical protein